MGAVLMTAEIAAALRPGDHGSTFGGGPVVASVAQHVLTRLSEPAFLERVRTDGAWLGDSLRSLAARVAKVRAVRGVGFMWGIDVMEPASDIIARAREHRLLVCSAGEYTIRLLPPLIATRAELARGLSLLEEVL
jgi:acetylornithine/succinyldiaminopimelate/putrescine aminotransferase